ncbi:MAG TPA: homoserine O-succinyltransferase, partial [Hyphomicrobiales bacterium]|nr:homoserine O-succinyltransferase [Hyphomicrobiales bacterium]
CEKLEDYHLFYGIPEKWRTPHSRYNTLPAEELLSAGYKVLSQLPGGNPDIFIKKKNSLSIFAQGHLEYDRETLIYEYRRDLGKYFSGESSLLPNIPEGYFDTKTAEAVQAWIHASLLAPQEADFGFINALFRNATLANGWRPIAVQLFSNWIALLLQDAARRRLAKSFRHSRPELSAADMEWRAE